MPALAVALVTALAAAAPPGQATVPPAPARWVEDHAALLSPAARGALDARLEAYERATGHQVVVWIGRTLGGAPIDDWTARTFATWKIGRKGLDDGIAMFVLADDRAIAIEVGYGLEDRVPDAVASRIIHDAMAPRLARGDREGAITAGSDALLAAIEGRPWSDTAPQPAVHEAEVPTWQWIAGLTAALAAMILFIRYPRLGLWALWSVLGNRGGGHSHRSGGFGGGGGRSGGGGARGTW